MHKNKVLLSLLFILSVMFIGCDKGEDTVNFSYIRDSYDPRIYHFKAKGDSDYGSFSYKWDFGDGNVAAGEVASFAFETYGSHLVTLTADISKSGIHTSVSKNILVEIPKIENMDFVYAVSKSNPKEYYFEADAKSDFGTIDYEWNFGNNNIDTGKRVTVNFDDYGFHEIKLNATLKESEEVTTELVKSIEIPTPEIRNLKFTYKIDSNDPRVVYFVAESDTTFGTVNYRWDFGNGDTKAGKEVSSMFTDYGKKTIKLTAELVELKQTVYREDTINVTPPLIKNLEFTYEIDPFNPLLVYFKATGKSDKGTVTFNWNFGRGNTDTGEEVNFRFDTFGEKNVYLIARNSTLNIEEYISKKIVLESPAIKDLKITHSRNKSNPLSATFRASGISDYDITYEWDFGDGIKRTGMTQTINFSEFGTKYITLTASIPSLNVKSTINSEFDLKQPTISKLNFTAFPDKKDTLDVYFVGSGTTDLGELEYKWDFGRGSSAEGSEASYKFKYYDTYPVKLTATVKGTQISASTTKNVNVTENNSLAFDYSYNDDSTSDKFLETQFLPQLNINLTGINYEWNFGDAESGVVNNTSSEKQPIHKFTKSNKYVVTLTVTANELISPLVLKKNVYILEKPIASVWIDRHSRDALNGTRRFDIWVMDTWSHILDRADVYIKTDGIRIFEWTNINVGNIKILDEREPKGPLSETIKFTLKGTNVSKESTWAIANVN